jgi:hypothetical protein
MVVVLRMLCDNKPNRDWDFIFPVLGTMAANIK